MRPLIIFFGRSLRILCQLPEVHLNGKILMAWTIKYNHSLQDTRNLSKTVLALLNFLGLLNSAPRLNSGGAMIRPRFALDSHKSETKLSMKRNLNSSQARCLFPFNMTGWFESNESYVSFKRPPILDGPSSRNSWDFQFIWPWWSQNSQGGVKSN